MITYLPIFSGNEARPFCDFACVFKRLLLKGNRAPQGVYSAKVTLRILGTPRPNCDLSRGLGEVVPAAHAGHEIFAVERPAYAAAVTKFTNRGQL